MGNENSEIKATVYGLTKASGAQNERNQSNAMPEDPFESLYDSGAALAPPYDFNRLGALIRMSNVLPQCIEAMEQNCEGFGYNLVEVIGKEDENATKLESQIKEEADKLKHFFDYASYEMSFTKLRKKLRRDKESLGNAFMEVLRNGAGDIDGFEYLKASTMRVGPLSDPIEIKIRRRKLGSFDYEEVPYRKRFRSYVQIISTSRVYFKEFGDPRIINSDTGAVVSEQDLLQSKKTGKAIIEATEVIHFLIDDPTYVYGIPRWTGNMVSVGGSRAAEEVNFDYFDNKTVPPLVVMVSGGTLSAETHKRIQEFIEEGMKGRENFHKALVLEAVGSSSPHSMEQSQVKIEMKELVQMQDGMFQDYEKNNSTKVRSAFRLPPIFLGLSEDYSRATAKESKEIAEEQVFGPEKADFDFIINNKIFPELEVKYHRFETRSAPVDNRKDQSEIIKMLSEGGLTNAEARKLMEKIVDVKLDELDPDAPENEWLKKPMKIAQMAYSYQGRQAQAQQQEPKKSAEEYAKDFLLGLQIIARELRKVA